jgi:acetylornithine deacetylase/succinyl-diaminopimelate desuccinylase-like protein
MSAAEPVLARFDTEREEALEALLAWLRIPSVSAQSEHAADCRAAAEWARARLAAIGFAAELAETRGHPVVFATHPGPHPGAPHLVYYGHYDVQPAEPLELWPSPPFSPTLVEGPHGKRVVARGAVDDKGQVAAWLAALTAWWRTHRSFPCRISVIIEGEEEIGSPHLEPFLEARRETIADALGVVISDTNLWDITTPAITLSLRGLLYTEITARGPDRDLHSGLFGGLALNPLNALTALLGRLWDETGRITIPHFYDGLVMPPERLRAAWQRLGFDAKAFLAGVGLTAEAGERDFSPLERLWVRPTADLNGLSGGYTGEGAKTVIPAEARAKLSFRLVPGQNPEAIFRELEAFLTGHAPPGLHLTLTRLSATPGVAVAEDSPLVAAAERALAAEFGKEPVLIGCGASIPVVESFKRRLGLDSLLMGFGLEDDRVHSPGEKFEVRCFELAARSHIRLLGALPAL